MIVPAIGAACLGAVVGWLVRYFITRFEKFTHQGLSAVVGVLLGAGVVRFLDQNPDVVWFYPMGLVIGFAIYHWTAAHYISKDQGGEGGGEKDDDPEVKNSGDGGRGGVVRSKRRGPLYGPKH